MSEEDKWHDMDSAPRDGTPIRAYCPTHKFDDIVEGVPETAERLRQNIPLIFKWGRWLNARYPTLARPYYPTKWKPFAPPSNPRGE